MIPRLQILSNIVERLKSLHTPTTGYLYGVIYNNTLTVLTFTLNITDSVNITDHYDDLQSNMPAEVYLCGLLHVGQCYTEGSDAFKDVDITDNPLLLQYSLHDFKLKAYFYIHQKLEPVTDIPMITESEIFQQLVYIRLQGTLPLMVQNFNVVESLQEVRKKVAFGKVALHFPSSNTYLLTHDDNTKEVSLQDFLCTDLSCNNSNNVQNKAKYPSELTDAISATILLKMSGDKSSEECIKYAPVLQHVKKSFDSLTCELNIDALSLVSHTISASELYAILVESICRNVKLVEKCVEKYVMQTEAFNKLPEPVHFKPHGCGHLFTVIFPPNSTNNDTVLYRKGLHESLGLGMTKPQFRQGNAAIFRSDLKNSDPLINPHEALPYNEGDIGRKVNIVDGLYAYHHYMQNGFDDNGWGCAYRSLQTIVSWYRFHGYTDISVPTHRTIQKCLVDISDKPSNFIGSTQWIGSTEVGFVLETLLGIEIKVLCASNGEEVSNLVPNLLNHFQIQGTPVMIGGGVLAHTILGVSLDEASGETKFLILDPHYTGIEHLPTITNKGWCGWKTKDFWKKNAFYNMCLPQRPKCI